eukprot:555460-Pyramimonas_sp.AAC.1
MEDTPPASRPFPVASTPKPPSQPSRLGMKTTLVAICTSGGVLAPRRGASHGAKGGEGQDGAPR